MGEASDRWIRFRHICLVKESCKRAVTAQNREERATPEARGPIAAAGETRVDPINNN